MENLCFKTCCCIWQEIAQTAEESKKQKDSVADVEKKYNQVRNLLQSAKNRITHLNGEVDKATAESKAAKEKLNGLQSEKGSIVDSGKCAIYTCKAHDQW